jgi:hypothetical protein
MSGDPEWAGPTSGIASLSALLRELPARWWAVLAHPRVRTFQRQRVAARWGPLWAGLAAQAAVQGAAVWLVLAGPAGSAGISSLPFGPKLRVAVAPPWLALAAFAGTFAQFFAFAALLWLSARRLGGQGRWLAHCWLLSLFWVPLMTLSALLELFGTPGSVAGLVARLYALALLGPMLAAAHTLSLWRAWAAVLVVVAAGLLLGVVVLLTVGVPAGLLAK